jgi:hypothetical protein
MAPQAMSRRLRDDGRDCEKAWRVWMARGSVFMSTSPPSAAGVKEVDMKTENLLPFQKLDIYIATKEFSRRVQIAKLRDRELRDQATRAAKSSVPGSAVCSARSCASKRP